MGAISKKLRLAEGNNLSFWCPGCNSVHSIKFGPGGWTWNGDAERPTFSPSVLLKTGHYAHDHSGRCWCTYNSEHPDKPAPFKCGVCHSFVVDGQIQFLGDCTHALAGQTVPLPDWPDWNEVTP